MVLCYDHEIADNYYAVFLDENVVAVHDTVYGLLRLLRKKDVFFYDRRYEDYIVYLLKLLSEYIETDEFQKRYGIEPKKCKPICVFKKEK